MSKAMVLEEPFKSRWRRGYLQTKNNGRTYVHLTNSSTDSTIISYARYLISVREGRFLSADEEVDHRDDNRTDDSLNNLKIMTPENNRLKEHNRLLNTQKSYHLPCFQCKETFVFSEREIKHKERQNVAHVFCSSSCAAKFHMTGRSRISEEIVSKIKQLRSDGKSSYFISDFLNVSRNTVMKYW